MPIIRAVDLFFRVIYFLVVVRVFLSWVPSAFNYDIVRFIYQVTDPILEPFRNLIDRFIPRGPGFYLDFSPIIALMVLDLIRRLSISFLFSMLY